MNYKSKIALCFITASILIGVATSASAQAVAYYTGNFEIIIGSSAISCEYRAGSQTFWVAIRGGGLCPLTITLR
jgi:hypothetical protein